MLAVGKKMPAWVKQAYHEYATRLPRQCELILKEIPAEKRTKKSQIKKIKIQESNQLLAAIPKNCFVIALDEQGKNWSTIQLSKNLQNWMMSGQDICLLIGGPEGLTQECLLAAQQRWSLSNLTFPHPFVRVIVAEQLFRAWSIIHNHPYHRD